MRYWFLFIGLIYATEWTWLGTKGNWNQLYWYPGGYPNSSLDTATIPPIGLVTVTDYITINTINCETLYVDNGNFNAHLVNGSLQSIYGVLNIDQIWGDLTLASSIVNLGYTQPSTTTVKNSTINSNDSWLPSISVLGNLTLNGNFEINLLNIVWEEGYIVVWGKFNNPEVAVSLTVNEKVTTAVSKPLITCYQSCPSFMLVPSTRYNATSHWSCKHHVCHWIVTLEPGPATLKWYIFIPLLVIPILAGIVVSIVIIRRC